MFAVKMFLVKAPRTAAVSRAGEGTLAGGHKGTLGVWGLGSLRAGILELWNWEGLRRLVRAEDPPLPFPPL